MERRHQLLKAELHGYSRSERLKGIYRGWDSVALCALKTSTKLAKVNRRHASSYPIMVGPSPPGVWHLNIHTGFASPYVRGRLQRRRQEPEEIRQVQDSLALKESLRSDSKPLDQSLPLCQGLLSTAAIQTQPLLCLFITSHILTPEHYHISCFPSRNQEELSWSRNPRCQTFDTLVILVTVVHPGHMNR